jgi:tetratricopeptide (TPR) repeat protein
MSRPAKRSPKPPKGRNATIDARADARRALLLGGLLLLVTLLAFGPALGHEFVNWDDFEAIVNNPNFNPPRLDKLVGYWTHPVAKFYVPVLWTVWGLLAFVAQEPAATANGMVLTPGVYHAFNVACHLVASLLAYRILRRLTRSDWAAFAGALWFAVHPLQVEAVVWVSGMKTPLSGVFAMLSVWHYLRFSDLLPGTADAAGRDAEAGGAAMGADSHPSGPRAWAHYAAATAAYVLAVLTKPTIILLPVVIAAIEILLLRRDWRCDWRNARRLWLPLGAWMALAVAVAVITKQAQPGILVYHPRLAVRPLVAADALAFYLYKFVLPFRLIPDYGRTPRWLIEQGPLYLTWVAPAAVLAACLALLRRAPWLAVGGLIFLVGMLPAIGLTPFDYQLFSTVADRYAYFSLFGPALALAYALARLRRPSWRVIAPTAAALGGLAVISFVQTGYWRDTPTLFRRTLEVNPDSLVAHRVFGYDAVARGRPDEAEQHYLAALHTAPEDGLTHYNLGNVFARQNRLEEAVTRYRAGLACPLDPEVRRDTYGNLGIALARTGRPAEALAAFDEAVRLDPADGTARANLQRLLSRYPDLRATPSAPPPPATTQQS